MPRFLLLRFVRLLLEDRLPPYQHQLPLRLELSLHRQLILHLQWSQLQHDRRLILDRGLLLPCLSQHQYHRRLEQLQHRRRLILDRGLLLLCLSQHQYHQRLG